MTPRLAGLAATFLFAASVLISLDAMEVVVYVDPGTSIEAPVEFAAREACGLLQSMRLALPVPYRIEWRKQVATGAMVPDESKVVTGLLTSCEQTYAAPAAGDHAPVANP